MEILFFYSDTCKVCKPVFENLNEIIKKYPKISLKKINIEENQELKSKYLIFSLPAILLFIDEKEYLREARFFNMKELEEKIKRYYEMIF